MNIPFIDLYSQYCSIDSKINDAIKRVIKNSSYVGGVEVANFEKEFSEPTTP